MEYVMSVIDLNGNVWQTMDIENWEPGGTYIIVIPDYAPPGCRVVMTPVNDWTYGE